MSVHRGADEARHRRHAAFHSPTLAMSWLADMPNHTTPPPSKNKLFAEGFFFVFLPMLLLIGAYIFWACTRPPVITPTPTSPVNFILEQHPVVISFTKTFMFYLHETDWLKGKCDKRNEGRYLTAPVRT